MVDEIPKLNITPKDKPEFRPVKNKQELLNLKMEVQKNGSRGESSIILMDGEKLIGSLDFAMYEDSEFAEVHQSAVDDSFRGNNLGMKMYEELISLAKQKNLEGLRSDRIVQGGAIATWIELAKKYNVSVYPTLVEKYQTLVKIYEEKKFFDTALISPGEHVFELKLK